MIRRIALIRRQPGLRHEEFVHHWLEIHAPIALGLDRLRGYRIGVITNASPRLGWDGVGELWFDSIDDAHAAFADGPMAEWIARDRAQFVGDSEVFFVKDHMIRRPRSACSETVDDGAGGEIGAST